jgi:hypothetical protein
MNFLPLILLIVVSSFGFERSIDSTIDQYFSKQKTLFYKEAGKGIYRYEYFPINLFPFFSMNQDSVKKLNLQNFKIVNFDEKYFYVSNSLNDKVLISILNYIDIAPQPTTTKTYTLFFFELKQDTKKWEQYRKPITLNFFLKMLVTYYNK